ncbi:acyl-CoA desaturase [Agromyces intestinalis]|uniref:Acyl-CoA desaturase n=1 Tax=Agromyces intestinalis TaxID=2592652 RepID=A0A5C1YHD5_9MICO|nr:acyl-CoA desaturase [Agromyces intestinalis]QEO14509.1 acyl-CoA desaturase [Agromyces intestinalis]
MTSPTNPFTELASRVRDAGLMRRRYGYYWTRLIGVPLAFAAAILAFILIGDTWWQMFTAAAFGVLFTQTAFLGHDAAHRQIFRSGRWNDWISLILGDLFIGMSYGWWQHKHTRHHANPNQIGRDPDIDLPVIAVTPEQAARPHAPIPRWIISHQGVFFFPLLLFEGISLHVASVHRLLAREHVARRPVELTFLGVRLIGFVTLVVLILAPEKAAVFLAIQLGVFGLYMGLSFAPNHKGMPIVPHELKLDFLSRQVLMSRNIAGGRALDTFMGGLNYQIEHHLFPSMPRPHLREASPMIERYCAEVGVPYTRTTLWNSYAIVLRTINRAGLGDRDPFACPLLEQRATGIVMATGVASTGAVKTGARSSIGGG